MTKIRMTLANAETGETLTVQDITATNEDMTTEQLQASIVAAVSERQGYTVEPAPSGT